MEPVNYFFQPLRQPVKNTTELLTKEPSGSIPPVHQKQSKLALNSFSVEKRKAEIFWALKCVFSDMSTFSVDGVINLFEVMFSGSEISKDFQMSQTKMTYFINFAIASYFMEILMDELKSCDYYSISFDERLNETTQTCQIDVHFRYWSKSGNQICVRYLDYLCYVTYKVHGSYY